MTGIEASTLTLGYGSRTISSELSVAVPEGSFTAIIGPNASGKSTLLRACARLIRPSSGSVLLDGRNLADFKAKELARQIGLLPQTSIAPEGIRVADLVARGRFPHQGALDRWSAADEAAVAEAMRATGVTEFSGRLVDELSGGQRQRVWVAMVLAQQTGVLLLDEPTTFLDIAHQLAALELFEDLNSAGNTIVAVLHDLNQAARYATHIIAMRDGQVAASGSPRDVITAELVEHVFDLRCRIIDDPESGTPMVIPSARR